MWHLYSTRKQNFDFDNDNFFGIITRGVIGRVKNTSGTHNEMDSCPQPEINSIIGIKSGTCGHKDEIAINRKILMVKI